MWRQLVRKSSSWFIDFMEMITYFGNLNVVFFSLKYFWIVFFFFFCRIIILTQVYRFCIYFIWVYICGKKLNHEAFLYQFYHPYILNKTLLQETCGFHVTGNKLYLGKNRYLCPNETKPFLPYKMFWGMWIFCHQ